MSISAYGCSHLARLTKPTKVYIMTNLIVTKLRAHKKMDNPVREHYGAHFKMHEKAFEALCLIQHSENTCQDSVVIRHNISY